MSELKEIIQSQLKDRVHEWIELDSIIVVRVDGDQSLRWGDTTFDRNVYAFDKRGNLRWKIQEIVGAESPKPFTSIKYHVGKLLARNWIGADYEVSLLDGSVRNVGPNARPW
jgi:hypothetical protein